MGKAKRKAHKKEKMRNMKNQVLDAQYADKVKEMEALEQKEQYAEALELLADLIEQGCRDVSIMYAGAKDYFMIGDYERSAKWVNNVLSFDANHVGARILLGRICLLEDRVDDAFAIFSFVLQNYEATLMETEKQEIEEIFYYYCKHEQEILRQECPAIYRFLQKRGKVPESDSIVSAIETEESESNTEEANSKDDVKKVLEDIRGKDISIAQKVRILNSFAASYYFAGSSEVAKRLLQEALLLNIDDQTLKNLAVVEMNLGNEDKALAYASRMEQADFLLLTALRK